jgi:hypothetical protein
MRPRPSAIARLEVALSELEIALGHVEQETEQMIAARDDARKDGQSDRRTGDAGSNPR